MKLGCKTGTSDCKRPSYDLFEVNDTEKYANHTNMPTKEV